jgi:EamA-like transporter family
VVIKNALADISPLFFNAVRMSLAAVVLAVIFYRELPRLTAGAVRFRLPGRRVPFCGQRAADYGAEIYNGLEIRFTHRSLGGAGAGAAGGVLEARHQSPDFHRRGSGICGIVSADDAGVGRGGAQPAQHESWRPAYAGRGVCLSHHLYRARDTKPSLAADHRGAGCGYRPADDLYRVFFSFLRRSLLGRSLLRRESSRGVVSAGAVGDWNHRLPALAFAIQAWAQQFTPATHTALIFTLEPVFAWLTSFIFLGERLGGRSGLGAACILAGLLISEEKASAESMGVSPDHAAVPAQHG